MAGRRCDVLDVREMLRRLRDGDSSRRVTRDLGVSRNTIKEYRRRFERRGWLDVTVPLPTAEEIERELELDRPTAAATPPRLMEFKDEITDLIATPLEIKVAWQRFSSRHPGLGMSYSTFRRFVRRYVRSAPSTRAVMRIEVGAGEEAQVDFGFAGRIPRRPGEAPRKTWVFVMTLSHSRHQFVTLVQDQSVSTWLTVHRQAFEFFGGVPARIVLDNLKAGIIKASVTDPEAQRSYRECAEYYGFLISPCVPRTPEHKGKVERGIGYVRRSFLAGRTFASLDEANAAAIDWVLEVAGVRIHGTTHEVPLEAFDARERPALRPLPASAFDLLEYKRATLHPDCHITFDGSYYSASYKLIGHRLWVRATLRTLQIFFEHRLIRTHVRAWKKGSWVQNPADFPPEKLAYSMQTPSWCRQRAAEIGPSIGEFVEVLLSDRVLDRLRGVQGLLRSVDRYGADRLDAACRRALACDALAVRSVETILKRGLDSEPLPLDLEPPPPVGSAPAYARTFFDLFDDITKH
jgi:transposase